MSKDPSRRKKPQRKYLDSADIPTISAPPPNTTYYRISTPLQSPPLEYGTQDHSFTSQTTLLGSPFADSDITRTNGSESIDIGPKSPDTLVEYIPPSISSNSALLSPLLLLSHDGPSQQESFLFSHQKENIPEHPELRKRISKHKRSPQEKLLEDMEKINKHLKHVCNDFGTIGEFLRLLSWSKGRKRDRDIREQYHQDVVRRFLQGDTSTNVINIIRKIF
ncbi:hypothetical protein K435DRAFT_864497 [Dendrothele bispora CBS 962.96]|uniref:Uncharacterized protein n=1 Tax=Dendrothele bispora (strain CBS 962.96) TaxID=1314807 RepID=A0A4S8LMA3_DENBC|nr:hypothetical protein K435DRAFT_864497 [Dendrothele bispora CBS 962.96]